VGTPVAVAVVAVAVAMSPVAVAVVALAMSPGPVAVTLHERLERLRRLLQRLLHHLRMVERCLGDGGAREHSRAQQLQKLPESTAAFIEKNKLTAEPQRRVSAPSSTSSWIMSAITASSRCMA